jgi:hypothetical protein
MRTWSRTLVLGAVATLAMTPATGCSNATPTPEQYALHDLQILASAPNLIADISSQGYPGDNDPAAASTRWNGEELVSVNRFATYINDGFRSATNGAAQDSAYACYDGAAIAGNPVSPNTPVFVEDVSSRKVIATTVDLVNAGDCSGVKSLIAGLRLDLVAAKMSVSQAAGYEVFTQISQLDDGTEIDQTLSFRQCNLRKHTCADTIAKPLFEERASVQYQHLNNDVDAVVTTYQAPYPHKVIARAIASSSRIVAHACPQLRSKSSEESGGSCGGGFGDGGSPAGPGTNGPYCGADGCGEVINVTGPPRSAPQPPPVCESCSAPPDVDGGGNRGGPLPTATGSVPQPPPPPTTGTSVPKLKKCDSEDCKKSADAACEASAFLGGAAGTMIIGGTLGLACAAVAPLCLGLAAGSIASIMGGGYIGFAIHRDCINRTGI